jgi:hypothetical protein
LRVIASATGYQTASSDFVLTAALLLPTPRVIEVNGGSITVSLPQAPLFQHQLALLPTPIHLSGRVVSADDHDTPVANALVHITAPELRGPVSTNANGFFTLHNLPVALEVTVQVTHTDFALLSQSIRLDYRHPVHQQLLALST